MRGQAFFFAALIVLGLAVPTYGQSSKPDQVAPSNFQINLARSLAFRLAQCVLTKGKANVKDYVNAKYDRPGEEGVKARGRLINGKLCGAEGSLSLPVFLFRGDLFKALYLSESGTSVALSASPFDYRTFVIDPSSPDSAEYLKLMELASCVARTDPAEARRYISARPGSEAETVSIGNLNPTLSSCFPANSTIKLTRPLLTAILSEALYRETIQKR
ncbi:MAG: hypothetical protein J0I80_12265 [Sphingomonas sp.]|nr:hypothetical protein [Sphingomonas sp.]